MTIRLRTLEHPDGTWSYVVDRVPLEEQDMFARAFNAFCDNVRERNPKCIGGLVFHDTVELPGEPEPHWETLPVPMDPVGEFGQKVTIKPRTPVLRPHCAWCGRQIEVYRNDIPAAQQTLYSHGDGEGGRCDGSKSKPVYKEVSHG